MAARLNHRHLDRLDAKLGAHLGEDGVAALRLNLGGVPLPVGGAVCVGELHFFLLGGGMVIGFVGPRSLSAFTWSKIAFWNSLVGAGAQPSWQARL